MQCCQKVGTKVAKWQPKIGKQVAQHLENNLNNYQPGFKKAAQIAKLPKANLDGTLHNKQPNWLQITISGKTALMMVFKFV